MHMGNNPGWQSGPSRDDTTRTYAVVCHSGKASTFNPAQTVLD